MFTACSWVHGDNGKKAESHGTKRMHENASAFYSEDLSIFVPHPEDVRYTNVHMLRVPARDASGVHFKQGERPYLVAMKPHKKLTPIVTPWRVTFDFDSDQIPTSEFGVVQSLVRLLNANPDMQIVLIGYADSKGSANYNRMLGLRRAKAVKKAMIKLGLKHPEQIARVESASESNHLANNNSKIEAASNRRVDAFVVGG